MRGIFNTKEFARMLVAEAGKFREVQMMFDRSGLLVSHELVNGILLKDCIKEDWRFRYAVQPGVFGDCLKLKCFIGCGEREYDFLQISAYGDVASRMELECLGESISKVFRKCFDMYMLVYSNELLNVNYKIYRLAGELRYASYDIISQYPPEDLLSQVDERIVCAACMCRSKESIVQDILTDCSDMAGVFPTSGDVLVCEIDGEVYAGVLHNIFWKASTLKSPENLERVGYRSLYTYGMSVADIDCGKMFYLPQKQEMVPCDKVLDSALYAAAYGGKYWNVLQLVNYEVKPLEKSCASYQQARSYIGRLLERHHEEKKKAYEIGARDIYRAARYRWEKTEESSKTNKKSGGRK